MSVEVKPEHARMLNNTKNITLGIAIVSAIQTVLSSFSIVSLFAIQQKKEVLANANVTAVVQNLIMTTTIMAVLCIAFTIILFLSFNKLRKGIIISPIVYYLYAAFTVLGVVLSMINSGVNFLSLILPAVLLALSVICILNLRRMK
ncbi:hypothetical protein QJV15_03995 [Listeria cossartiae subsp. cayugensis]|uniref:hypothetical protein n=1 Tax=Listeria cossartiae TaxID=2838249 RepID=UPI00288086BE|nr:hypothetical protein [Listeria cossartiae]MDT0000043.1 hypothetical protein [Listeria cossartiae subsp. cayugensis]MDT0007511.1 hypothetical protein [Listeria cossartiae subsp. cayugensis]MDT0030074.1 hypothetical protein [Listeria cossartiae subsp. cayugensis]MDT0038189.1 hypothetical protein [Listeria cossartiae subsp. cayugensis]MDT0043539.1 hypothetical protein [Listeria cossartiae subsp. cayugensis]